MNGKEILLFLVIFASWFALNRWVLPWMGIPTCMSGSCSTGCPLPPTYADTKANGDDAKSVEEVVPSNRAEEAIPAGDRSVIPGRP